jgi:2'-5' RNA ligase
MNPPSERGGASGPGDGRRRLFVAVFPPPPVLEALDPVRERLDAAGESLRWVARENLHYTLRFFGAMTGEEACHAAGVLDAVAAATRPFSLEMAGVGVFPGWARPRVLWAGCGAGAPVLEALARTLDHGFLEAGLGAADKPFRAHLTLARWRPGAPADPRSLESAARNTGPIATFTVEGIGLIESRLGPGGSRYRTVHHAALAGAARG